MNKRIIDKMPRVFYHMKGLFFNFNADYNRYYNQYTQSVNESEDFDFIMIQLNPKWLSVDKTQYDGHGIKTFTILGVSFGYGHSYEWKDLKVAE